MSGLLNKKACRQFMIDYSARSEVRGGGHTQVAQDIYNYLEAKARQHCRFCVDQSPGKTVSLETRSKKGEQI